MKRFSLVLCGFLTLILVVPAAQAAITLSTQSTVAESGVILGDIEVSIDIRPNSISHFSKGEYVTCYITPPEGYSAQDIDTSSIFLETLQSNPDFVGFIDKDLDGVCELMVKFDRPAVLEMLLGSPSDLELTVTGSFEDGQTFFGVDSVHYTCSS